MKDNNRDLAGRWLHQAQSDLDAARWNAQGGFWANACFFAQQASEKALKAYLYALGERDVLGHSLLSLSRRCKSFDKAFSDIERECRRLDKYYITSRYPNGLPDSTPAEYFDQEEAEEAMGFGQTIVQMVQAKLAHMFKKGESNDSSAS